MRRKKPIGKRMLGKSVNDRSGERTAAAVSSARVSIFLPTITVLLIILATVSLYHVWTDGVGVGKVTLLTVADDDEGTGGTAEITLNVRPGGGAIYIDSFPLTKVDTQSSVRYANQIACDLLQKDCSRYDFFYTIRANSAIVGGPSAGAAITVLTVAILDGKTLDPHVAMTGTINSGGIIGPVAGISAKVKGAKSAGITKVLIPSLTSDNELRPKALNFTLPLVNNASYGGAPINGGGHITNSTIIATANGTINKTIDGVDDGGDDVEELPIVKQLPLETGKVQSLSDDRIVVLRVSTVEEALREFTGKNYSLQLRKLDVPREYTARMAIITQEICNRTVLLNADVAALSISYNDTHNYTERIAALPADHMYSHASLCFSENIELDALIMANKTVAERKELLSDIKNESRHIDVMTRARPIQTMGDLEAYAIVKERILEANDLLDGIEKDAPAARDLAYARERLVSAKSWSRFFGMPGPPVQIDTNYLQRACLSKMSEAEERISYVRLYVPSIVDESERLLSLAREYSVHEPILCIFTASKAKAQANLLSSAISIGPERVDALLAQKLYADSIVLSKQQEKGFFPILGYSYTQYAEDLRHALPYSGLSFAEDALELSNLDLYFPKETTVAIPLQFWLAGLLTSCGALAGIMIATLVLRQKR